MGSMFKDKSSYTPQQSYEPAIQDTNTNVVTSEEEIATPAVAEDVQGDAEQAAEQQAKARAMKNGIRSTYSRFNDQASNATGRNGGTAKLGQ